MSDQRDKKKSNPNKHQKMRFKKTKKCRKNKKEEKRVSLREAKKGHIKQQNFQIKREKKINKKKDV